LLVPAAEMLRMRWNPFYPFVEHKVLEFLGLGAAAAATQGEADAAASTNG
jgi:hypothetical protein